MVITEFCGSSGFSVPAFAAKAPTLGAPDTYADCAATGATAIKVASVRPKIVEIARVYFMPEESNFFTPKRVKGHSQVIRCTPDAEIGPSESAYVLDCRGRPPMCQVTKGARIWSCVRSPTHKIPSILSVADAVSSTNRKLGMTF